MAGPPRATAAVRLAVRRSLAELPPVSTVLVACSGGADSLALAAAAAHEAPRAGLSAGGVTVDHGLQTGSALRAAAVGSVLRDLGLDPVEVLSVDVGGAGGPEAAARTARYAALAEAAGRLGAAAVLLGHTRDDQAETVLLGLARGSGARSLSGMRPVSGLLRRPLLGLTRSTVRAACAEAGSEPWEDPHNADPTYARARVRHAALPALESTLGPGVAAALARTADLLRDDADALDGWALDAARVVGLPDGGLDVDGLLGMPAAVRTRVLRAWVLTAGAPATDLTAAHVQSLDALVTGWRGQAGVDLPGGLRAVRVGRALQLVPTPR